jgi:SAM-dependent methyltransferase
MNPIYEALRQATVKPAPFSVLTAETLWTDEHISAQMLQAHLHPDLAPASRPHAVIRRSLDWLTQRFGLAPGKRVTDFGCGPGLYTTGFAERGATVTGLDFSRRSLDYARKVAAQAGLTIDYIETDYRTYEPQAPADLVTLIYCDFCALAPADRHKLLRTFHKLLRGGGHLVLDVVSTAAFETGQERTLFGERLLDGFWAAGPYYGLLRSFRYETEHIGLDHYTIWEPQRCWEIYNWLQYFSPDQLQHEFAAAGLRIIETCGDVCGAPYDASAEEFAIVAVAAD